MLLRRAGLPLLLLIAGLAGTTGSVQAAGFLDPFSSPLSTTTTQAVMGGDGTLAFSDTVDAGVNKALRFVVRPPGGPAGGAANVPAGGVPSSSFLDTDVAVGASGDVAVAYVDVSGPTAPVKLVRRNADGTWGAPLTVTQSGDARTVAVGLDAQGVATVAWGTTTPVGGGNNVPTVQAKRITRAGVQSSTQTVQEFGARNDTTTPTVSVRETASGRALLRAVLYLPPARFYTRDAADQDFSAPFTDPAGASGSTVVLGADGTAGFASIGSSDYVVRLRPAGGSVSGPITIAPASGSVAVELGVDGAGQATVAWIVAGAKAVAVCRVVAAGCAAGSTQIVDAVANADSLTLRDLAIGADGTALVTVTHRVAATNADQIDAMYRPAGAPSFIAPQSLGDFSTAQAFSDDHGNGLVAMGTPTLAYRPFDGAAPALTSVSAPGTLAPGAAGSFAAAASDLWGPVAVSWSFGDGATAAGAAAQHAYAAAGTYAVTATTTDAAGNATSATRTVTVAATGVGPGGPGPGGRDGGATDRTKPVVSRLKQSHATFRVGAKPTATAAKRAPAGTTFSYTLSEPATVTFTIERVLGGRRSGSRCVTATKRNRKAKACKRYKKSGTLTRTGRQGASTLAFTGRIGRKALARGSYRITLVARDPAGNVGAGVATTFRVVRG